MVQFDAGSIKTRIANRLKAKASWANILFFSTNQRLIDAIAEEISYDMQYDEKLTTEGKWGLAQQRSSLLAENQFFNYYPHRKVGATGLLKISSDENFALSYAKNISVRKFDIFSNDSINFVATENKSLLTNETFTTVPIVQGKPRTETFYATGGTYETFVIENDSIENTVFDVYVNNQLVAILTNIREAETGTELVCVVENKTDMSGIKLRFGNDSYGKKLTAGDLVLVNYVETLGSTGNIDSEGIIETVTSTIYDSSGTPITIFCTNTEAIVGGTDYEEIEEIRARAPKAYQAGQRAINREDYASVVGSFSFIKKVIVWGEAEVNEDLGNIPGTYIALQENVVHIAAISSVDAQITEGQETSIRDNLNEKKPPTDIVVFENVNFIYIVFNVEAHISSKQYVLSNIIDDIRVTLEKKYSISNLEFKKAIRASDYVSLIDQVKGVDYHDSTISYFKYEKFVTAYVAPINIQMEHITTSSVSVYVKNILDISSVWVKVAHDNGSGSFVADAGYTVSASSIDYLTGIGNIIITAGLSLLADSYTIKVVFACDSANIVPTVRYQFISYGDSIISAQYE